MDIKSAVICGVGGQGIVLASDMLAEVMFRCGYDVKKNEIHGMSQREGSVVSFVRWGERVFSPVVSMGEGDFLLAFEYLEGLRYLSFLRRGGIALVSTTRIEPVPVKLGRMAYPSERDELFTSVGTLLKVDTDSLCREIGNPKLTNTILLGVFSCFLPAIEVSLWEGVIRDMVKPAYQEINLKAFEKGREMGFSFLAKEGR
ncbi:Indolepyruvate oxidoreductase subunit IorB [Brevinematales bacterium NS]|nr:indolepyruvate oxidoreductase subunit beta [Brevinematales bacterium]QJR20848.1 Indolepyruvate oxidoreductase subunit IorB [Brevinematales bacterium NS]